MNLRLGVFKPFSRILTSRTNKNVHHKKDRSNEFDLFQLNWSPREKDLISIELMTTRMGSNFQCIEYVDIIKIEKKERKKYWKKNRKHFFVVIGAFTDTLMIEAIKWFLWQLMTDNNNNWLMKYLFQQFRRCLQFIIWNPFDVGINSDVSWLMEFVASLLRRPLLPSGL